MEKVRIKINNEGKIKLLLTFSLLAYSICVSIKKSDIGALSFMLFATIADICIMASRGAVTGRKEKEAFNLGIILFTVVHFICSYIMQTEIIYNIICVAALYVVPIAVWLKPPLDKIAYIPYGIALVSNTINAWHFSIIAGIGATLFVISDAVLAICEERSPKWQILIWATYVPAQILLLTAILLS